jgi:uncharacterized protein with FMN-binding domain
MEAAMKKFLLILCALMLLLSACAPDDGNLNEDETNEGIDEPIDGNNTGANADNDTFDGEERTLTGTAQGYGGEITVTVVVNGEDIVSVEEMGKDETEGVGSLAIEQLPDKIEQADSTDVDDISGATKTSQGIKQAVENALKSDIQSKQNQP